MTREGPPFVVEMLDRHDRTQFSCGTDALDAYFKQQVTQDVRRRVTACFVALEVETGIVAGFYTLAAASVAMPDLPEATARKLPRYPSIPAIRVGRLAVDKRFRGRGLGGALLADATRRGLKSEVGAFALLVDAKDDDAIAFYLHHGFQRIANQPRTLFAALATLEKAAKGGGLK